MLKGSSSTPTVDTDKPVQEPMTSDTEDHPTQDADNEELFYEEE